MGLTQRQLALLRKLVKVSSSIHEGASIEFVIDRTVAGTCAMFLEGGAPEVEGVSNSDMNELRRSGYVLNTGVSGGEPTFQVANEAFALFRSEDVEDESVPPRYKTGDASLDELLDVAITKYKLHDTHERKDAIEKLWDAWERLKTLESSNKKASMAALLDRAASEPTFREILEKESRTLTGIGNDFRIRHHEKGKIHLSDPHQVDYFFRRMLSMIQLLLRKSGRM